MYQLLVYQISQLSLPSKLSAQSMPNHGTPKPCLDLPKILTDDFPSSKCPNAYFLSGGVPHFYRPAYYNSYDQIQIISNLFDDG